MIDALVEAVEYFQTVDSALVNNINRRKKRILTIYEFLAIEAGFYKQLNSKYKLGIVRAAKSLREEYGYDTYEFYVNKAFPKIIKFQSLIRAMYKKIIYLVKPANDKK